MPRIFRFKIFLFFAAIVVSMLMFSASSAQAQTSRVYFAGYMGLSTFGELDFSESTIPVSGDIEVKNTLNYAGALGLRLSPVFRVEAEAAYRNADLDRVDFNNFGSFKAGGDLASWTGMVNLYYDFDVDWKIKPFLGAGVGFGWHEGTINDLSGIAVSASDDATNFIWQVGGGLKYRISPEFAFTSAYRYMDGTDLEFGSYDLDYSSHEFRLGFEYDLPVN